MFELKVERKGDNVLFEAWRGEELIARHEVAMTTFRHRAGVQTALDQTFLPFLREVGEWIVKNTQIPGSSAE